MPITLTVAPELLWRALVVGAILSLILIVAAHLIRPFTTRILFAGLVITALAYVWFAFSANAGPVWLVVESAGVVIYGIVGWFGVRRSVWWLAAGWALHPIWDVGLHWLGPGRALVNPVFFAIPCISFDLVVAAYIALALRDPNADNERALRARAR